MQPGGGTQGGQLVDRVPCAQGGYQLSYLGLYLGPYKGPYLMSSVAVMRKVGVQDTASFGVSVRLETLPGSGDDDEKEGGGGLFGGLLGGKKKEKKEEAKEEAGGEGGAWVKQTTVYPRKSTVPSKPKTVAFNYDKVTLFPLPRPSPSLLTVDAFNYDKVTLFSLPRHSPSAHC